MSITQSPRGLQGVTAVNSSICYIDGEQGVLAYRGIDIHELATHSNFEECCYLLWCGRLPNQSELEELKLSLARERKLDPAIVNLLRQAPMSVAHQMSGRIRLARDMSAFPAVE